MKIFRHLLLLVIFCSSMLLGCDTPNNEQAPTTFDNATFDSATWE